MAQLKVDLNADATLLSGGEKQRLGIAGISNDLNVPENTHPAFYKMVQVEEYIKKTNNIFSLFG